jgi:transposase
VATAHVTLHAGETCPHCRGRVYARPPRRLVRIVGVAPFAATVYEQERLRCNLCGEVYTARAPEGVGEEKHDASAVAMVALLRYGLGMPFYRVEALQESAGIPLPASTQWDLVHAAADALAPVEEALREVAASGEVLHNDDTAMTVLSALDEGADAEGCRGVFTTALLARAKGRTVALYATGRRHAGENLGDLLTLRPAEQGPPIQMCDALSRNVPAGLATILSSCLVHMRRQFVDVAESFPTEVRRVIDELAEVYRVEEAARGLSKEARLALHQAHSQPVMDRLALYLAELVDERRVEPSSGLGKAIAYAQKRWDRLTLFLRVAGAPLDNNACEQVLKRAILHRKNSLFYKTQNGARVGDLFMSLIATARLCDEDPFHYLTELLRHPRELAAAPKDWLPWTYRATLARAPTATSGP